MPGGGREGANRPRLLPRPGRLRYWLQGVLTLHTNWGRLMANLDEVKVHEREAWVLLTKVEKAGKV